MSHQFNPHDDDKSLTIVNIANKGLKPDRIKNKLLMLQNHRLELEDQQISEIKSIQMDLKILKYCLKELDKVNHEISCSVLSIQSVISELEARIGSIVARHFLKTTIHTIDTINSPGI